MTPPPDDLWIFAYGSLMWHPGFPVADMRPARLEGYHRAFCVYSIHYRGTRQRPGLVLGLARGSGCNGVAIRVPPESRRDVLAYLRERELIYGVYRETRLRARLASDSHPACEIDVLTYVADMRHPSFAGDMSITTQARIIRTARGRSGSNLAYLAATQARLTALGIRQPELDRLAALTGVTMLSRTDDSLHMAHAALADARGRAQHGRPSPAPSIPFANRHAFAFRCRIGG
ncbi:MAG: gamma-glutamylcyclotransferase [Hyphomicrobium sp.]|nr:gamma-glutamylcyclotransferase [Hyphomicrobium sp.]